MPTHANTNIVQVQIAYTLTNAMTNTDTNTNTHTNENAPTKLDTKHTYSCTRIHM